MLHGDEADGGPDRGADAAIATAISTTTKAATASTTTTTTSKAGRHHNLQSRHREKRGVVGAASFLSFSPAAPDAAHANDVAGSYADRSKLRPNQLVANICSANLADKTKNILKSMLNSKTGNAKIFGKLVQISGQIAKVRFFSDAKLRELQKYKYDKTSTMCKVVRGGKKRALLSKIGKNKKSGLSPLFGGASGGGLFGGASDDFESEVELEEKCVVAVACEKK